jgi:hypothetical protein
MSHRVVTAAILAATISAASPVSVVVAGQRPQGSGRDRPADRPANTSSLPRTPDGRPDLQGNWSIATLTPLQRPAGQEAKATLTEAEAAAIENRTAERVTERNRPAAPKSEAPPAGGNVGGYNNFWLDGGTTVAIVNGKRPTSLIVDPPDGRIPFTPQAQKAQARARARYGVGPYDSYADLDTGERCLTDGIPWTPFAYNNNFQIVQTPDHVAILREQFAELRIVPTNGSRRPASAIRQWAGDSRGRWDGDTLVVDTADFADKTSYEWADTWRAARPSLHVVERFTLVDARTIHYEFTVDDPSTFTKPWTALVPMTRTGDRIYEYACHEGNIAMGNILRGARADEADKEK